MALHWCWAFGTETPTLLRDNMEWVFDPASSAVSNTFTYTYAGSPPRQSMRVGFGSDCFPPSKAYHPVGWVTTAFYANSNSWVNGGWAIQVRASNGRYIGVQVSSPSSNAFSLYVDNVFKATFSAPVVPQNWQYLALRYDMTTATWSGQAFLNGVAVTGIETDSGTAQPIGSPGTFFLEGIGDNSLGTLSMYLAQIAVYDDLADTPETPRFVTRINPDTDSSEVGTWTPSAGATNVGVTANDPFDPATYTEDSTPVSGENVVTTFAADIATQIGVNPTSIDGVTTHAYASGTAIDAFAACGSGGAFFNGDNFTPDVTDTTYGYGTAPLNPNTVAAWVGTDTVQTKFEIV